MSGNTLEGVDRKKCPSAQFHGHLLVKIAQKVATDIPDGKNCMDPTSDEAIKIVEVIIAFDGLADALRGAFILQICSSKAASSVMMLPNLKIRLKSVGVGIIILNENSLHMSHYGRISWNLHVNKKLHNGAHTTKMICMETIHYLRQDLFEWHHFFVLGADQTYRFEWHRIFFYIEQISKKDIK